MLVKINDGVYINTDHIFKVLLLDDGSANVYNVGERDVYTTVSSNAAEYLLDIMEANTALITPKLNIEPRNSFQALVSQSAVLLRDRFGNGATVDEVLPHLDTEYNLAYKALQALVDEHVAVYDPTSGIYYHASHRPNEPTFASEVDLDLASINTNRFIDEVASGSTQCVECKQQSCPTCAIKQACCKCNCPSFTAYTDLTQATSAEAIAIHEAKKQEKYTNRYPYQCVNAGCDQEYENISQALSCNLCPASIL